jgi:hypothetical protein
MPSDAHLMGFCAERWVGDESGVEQFEESRVMSNSMANAC